MLRYIRRYYRRIKRSNLAKNIILLIIVLLFCFAITEASLRAIDHYQNKDLTFQGKQLFIKSNITYNGYEPKPGITVELDGINYSINKDGFRDKEYSLEKNNTRIIVLGDSVTMGQGVEIEQTFPKLIEQDLENTDVINLGVIGYSTFQEVAFFKEKGLKYKPDIVVLGYVLNDASADAYINNQTSFTNCRFNLLNIPINCKLKNILSESLLLRKVRELARSDDAHKDRYIAEHEDLERWNFLVSQIEELQELSKENNFTIVVVIIPVITDYDNYLWRGIHEKLTNMFTEHNITSIDALDAFSKEDYTTLLVKEHDPWHPNAKGHKIIAKELEPIIEDITRQIP